MLSRAAALHLPTPPPGDLGGTDPLAVLDDPLAQQRFTTWRRQPDGSREALSSFVLSGMHCAACAGLIADAWQRVDGVLQVQVSAASQRAQVRWDTRRCSVSGLVRALRAVGYDAAPDDAASARALRQRERRTALWRLFVAGFCAMQVMMFAAPAYLAEGSELAPDLRQLLNWGAWLLTLPVMLFAAGPFFQAAWRGLRAGRIVMDLPVALGIAVGFAASSGATFDPGGVFGAEVYFDSLTMFVSFLLAGRCLEMAVRHRAAEALERSVAGMPEVAQRLRADGEVETVSVQRLQPGDRVRVALGAAFPADGWLEGGQTEADESLLSGESQPVAKRSGDPLVGGSVNLAAPVLMRVERVGADTRFAAIGAMVRDAMSQRPAMTRQADEWAGPFLWAVLLLAAGAAAVWSVLDPSRAIWVAVSVLIVTCPCALSLAAPSAMVAAAGALARRGVLLQRLDALLPLARLSRLYLDKTGTLTEAQPRWLRTLRAGGGLPDAGAIRAAVALAGWSRHPLAHALAADPEVLQGPAPQQPTLWHDVQEQPGQGLAARDATGRCWRLGSRAWVEQVAPRTQPPAGPADDSGEPALPQVWFGREGRACLCFEFDERLRPDAEAALQTLAADGVQLGLLSGDGAASVRRLATRLGIAEVLAGARPEDKLRVLAEAQARGEVVGMVGDGVNDAPVLARADVSFAMGQGALLARAHADAVVVSSRLQDIAFAHRLARRTLRVVRQNLAWAALYNAACIPLALTGHLPPWAAGLGMAASSLLVVGNSLRLTR
ncbi:MAG TPA: cation-translocating P-type ATPase [Ideonella sp.]|nr:cation-translocating P-type ATPase [Ideonella sp.]